MATLLLGAIGSALGGSLLGAVGATVGQAVGAIAGSWLDQTVFGASPREGPRLADLTLQSSAEGMPIARVYGRARLSGQVIWATDYEEVRESSGGGGKGSQAVTSYSYFANVAIAVCEGPINRIGRIFADGVEIDRTLISHRVHLGSEGQSADPFILAKEGNDAPAYRGVAYVVFERLPLEPYGNRLPVFTFEVIRSVEPLETMIRAVTLIPGSTEFGYGTSVIRRDEGYGATQPENTHVRTTHTNVIAALDELQALCPQLTSVSLVIAWFGTDLRVGQCRILPSVDQPAKTTPEGSWNVAGQTRATARVVSQINGRAAYGGTPSDASILEAIAELKRRGLKVTLLPFVLMDIPADNTLPDPYGAARQAAHPWRGRITCSPAPGLPGSPDLTSSITASVDTFVGTVTPADVSIQNGTVLHAKPSEWSLSRMILHYARLAQLAGGVDAFLVGSELRGLTTLRAGPGVYPFVERLRTLAKAAKTILGSGTKISYAADWSEWFGHQPANGSGDVYFHLDPLWSDPAIDAIGIDVYWPLSDWRRGPHADQQLAPADHDLAYLKSRLTGGEGYDWYYASAGARAAGQRTPILDGTYQEPWVFRFKDIQAWWSNRHYNRPNGVRQSAPTSWIPQSKPIWFTELGCPAINHGANQPNVFVDPKSSENAFPHFSNGSRDDLIQRRLLEAHLATWSPTAPGFDPARNPVSTVYGGRMVDPGAIAIWTFDARPYPAFPLFSQIWADGAAWFRGHWINGRLGSVSIAGLIKRLAQDHGVVPPRIESVDGIVDGFVVTEPTSIRAVLEPLAAAFGFSVVDLGPSISVRPKAVPAQATVPFNALVDPLASGEKDARFERVRANTGELSTEVTVVFHDPFDDFQRATASAFRPRGTTTRVARVELPLVCDPDRMTAQAEVWLNEAWLARETVRFALPLGPLWLEPGDVITLATPDGPLDVSIDRITDGAVRRIEARRQDLFARRRPVVPSRPPLLTPPPTLGPPLVWVIDLPALGDDTEPHRPWLAATATPWPGGLSVWQATGPESFRSIGTVTKPARLGRVVVPPPPGPIAVIDRFNTMEVEIRRVALASVDRLSLFSGANLAAVGTPSTGFQLLQFETATLIGPDRYRLSGLIRGLRGTEAQMAPAPPLDSWFILIDDALLRLPLERDQLGTALRYRVTPLGHDVGSTAKTDLSHAASGRALQPLSPVHVRARRSEGGDIDIRWVRRSRFGADSWHVEEISLGETSELYRLQILQGAAVRRTLESTQAKAVYTLAQQLADFGGPQNQLSVRLAQIAPGYGAGEWRTAVLSIGS